MVKVEISNPSETVEIQIAGKTIKIVVCSTHGRNHLRITSDGARMQKIENPVPILLPGCSDDIDGAFVF